MECPNCKELKRVLWSYHSNRIICSECGLSLPITGSENHKLNTIDLSSRQFKKTDKIPLNSQFFTELPVGFWEFGGGENILNKLVEIDAVSISSEPSISYDGSRSNDNNVQSCELEQKNTLVFGFSPKKLQNINEAYLSSFSENELCTEYFASAKPIMGELRDEILLENYELNVPETDTNTRGFILGKNTEEDSMLNLKKPLNTSSANNDCRKQNRSTKYNKDEEKLTHESKSETISTERLNVRVYDPKENVNDNYKSAFPHYRKQGYIPKEICKGKEYDFKVIPARDLYNISTTSNFENNQMSYRKKNYKVLNPHQLNNMEITLNDAGKRKTPYTIHKHRFLEETATKTALCNVTDELNIDNELIMKQTDQSHLPRYAQVFEANNSTVINTTESSTSDPIYVLENDTSESGRKINQKNFKTTVKYQSQTRNSEGSYPNSKENSTKKTAKKEDDTRMTNEYKEILHDPSKFNPTKVFCTDIRKKKKPIILENVILRKADKFQIFEDARTTKRENPVSGNEFQDSVKSYANFFFPKHGYSILKNNYKGNTPSTTSLKNNVETHSSYNKNTLSLNVTPKNIEDSIIKHENVDSYTKNVNNPMENPNDTKNNDINFLRCNEKFEETEDLEEIYNLDHLDMNFAEGIEVLNSGREIRNSVLRKFDVWENEHLSNMKKSGKWQFPVSGKGALQNDDFFQMPQYNRNDKGYIMANSFRKNGEKTYKILPEKPKPCIKRKTAKPLHLLRVEKALDVNHFLHNLKVSAEDTSSDSGDDANNEELLGFKVADFITPTDYYNFSNVSGDRQWLADILQENTDNPPDEVQYQHILKLHSYQKNLRQSKKNFNEFMYYGAGLVSTIDHYSAMEKTASSPLSKRKKRDDVSESILYPSNMLDDIAEEPCLDLNLENGLDFQTFEDDSNVNCNFNSSNVSLSASSGSQRKKVKKFKDEEAKKKWEDMMTTKRKRVFTNLIKKEVGKQQRSKSNRHKETLLQCKRVAQQCAKVVRQKAVLSARIVKEQQWRMKRLARENIAYWKRSRRLDREVKKRLEKEAEEQRKIDHELIEAKRQQRKLNFLITQTELYAHFMSKKLGTASAEEQLRILNQLDEDKNPRLAAIDEYDSEVMKETARKNAEEAFLNERSRTKHFDLEANSTFMGDLDQDGEQPQPKIFRGKLKGYQLRGMNWLANLYSQGISGILADEMGLGKTVQSIAFLCHIAEKYAVWGPFLIISPASTLHNWQQEIAKFVPSLKVVPYWGNPNERKILRQFWDQKDIYTKEASFHIVITSYQIVITDIKYFNRIKWQYMILDEAQAIKSTSSMRWKTLLGFSCRNRLLLSGTPIQNSMAELWALLHFIMPTLFDSHEEFNEWFSKDIESHAENKTGIDEKHLSRLHMILKPFMLRRIKKDVENELSDKIEIMVYCPLTTRQKLLYIALKQKIKIEDLIHYSVGGGDAHSVDKNFTSNLMNLVMQFRKVCNHPELFERRDAKSPIFPKPVIYNVPRLVYDLNLQKSNFLFMQKYFLFTCEHIASAVNVSDTIFNFCSAMHLSANEMYQILQGNILKRWQHYYYSQNKERSMKFVDDWSSPNERKPSLNIVCHTSLFDTLVNNLILQDLVFTRHNSGSNVVYGHAQKTYFCSSEQKFIDNLGVSQEIDIESTSTDNIQISKLGDDNNLKFIKQEYAPSELPSFLSSLIPKIQSSNIILYCSSRRAAHDYKRHINEFSYSTLNFYWSEATGNQMNKSPSIYFYPTVHSPIDIIKPINGWSNIYIPDKETLVTDAGKLSVLDSLLKKLKKEGHRVLIYSQMTKMIDLLEEYMWHRHHKYMRLDGSSKISERRDMVADFQARTDIFVFLLSTRAGGLGINLTAADTVIFYDSDWNPTVDQQAMDRAHRLGQTKQVTVYRLICKGTIEERILQRAREKSEIQKLVISGGNFKPDTLKPKEVVSLLLDEDELVQKFHKSPVKMETPTVSKIELISTVQEGEKRKRIDPPFKTISAAPEPKRQKVHDTNFEDQFLNVDSMPTSPQSVTSNDVLTDDLSDASFFEDNEGSLSSKYTVYNVYGSAVKPRTPARGSSKRGRPRGSRRASTLSRLNSTSATSGIFASDIGDASTASSSNLGVESSTVAGMSSPTCTVRRGPGRPRLKPSGPLNTSTRGAYKPRKPTRPLPVPLPSDGTNATTTSSHLYSSYVFDFPEHPDP